MKIKTGQGNMTLQKLIAIYSISMVTSLPGLAISPILGKLESIFSSTSELQLQMLESLPSFIIVPFILLGRTYVPLFQYKKLLITGLAIFSACSIAYPFADRMWALLLISGLLGIGAGLVIPFSTGLVADYFSGSYRTKQLGYVSAITNLTLVIATLLAGFLAGISWHLSFVVYCISGISLFSHSIWTKNHLSIPLRPKRQLRFNSRRHIIIKIQLVDQTHAFLLCGYFSGTDHTAQSLPLYA